MPARKKRTRKPGKPSDKSVGPGTKGVLRKPGDAGQLIVLSEREDDQALQPCRIPLLPLRSDVVFPQTVVPLVVNRPSGIRLIDDCMVGERMVGLVSQL